MSDRHEYIEGLRQLAALLEANPEIPLPYEGDLAEITIFCASKEELAAITRAFPGPKDKRAEDYNSYGFALTGKLAGLAWEARVDRDEVCTARVVGTKTVTQRRPSAYEEVEVEVEEIEWDCHPILIGTAASEPVA